jgi:Glutaredoxin
MPGTPKPSSAGAAVSGRLDCAGLQRTASTSCKRAAIDLGAVTAVLERGGVQALCHSYHQLLTCTVANSPRWLQPAAADRIAPERSVNFHATMNCVTVYGKPTCTTCRRLVALLTERGIEFKRRDYMLEPCFSSRLSSATIGPCWPQRPKGSWSCSTDV